MKTALTIAGSDSSGGAGIQADIKTMMANGVYAMSAITALTAQNTTGVAAIQNATPEFLAQEIDCIFTDIEPDAVKVGMVSEKKLIKVISDKLKQYKAKNIVIDPVMVATSGARLINEDAVDTLKKELFHLAMILTPNIPEAEELAQIKINNSKDMIKAAGLRPYDLLDGDVFQLGMSKEGKLYLLDPECAKYKTIFHAIFDKMKRLLTKCRHYG